MAKVIVDQWKNKNNQHRQDRSMRYQTFDEFAAICNRRLQSGYYQLPSPNADREQITHTRNTLAEHGF